VALKMKFDDEIEEQVVPSSPALVLQGKVTEVPAQLVFLADNGQVEIRVTLEDQNTTQESNDVSTLDQFKAAYYTWFLLTQEEGHLRNQQKQLQADRQELKVRIIKGQNYCALHKDSTEGKALLAKLKAEAGLIDTELPKIEAKLRSIEERERDEAERMTEAEQLVAGPGKLICGGCFGIYPIDQGCKCWWEGMQGAKN